MGEERDDPIEIIAHDLNEMKMGNFEQKKKESIP